MKRIILVLAVLLVLVASPSFAAVQVEFTDGKTMVWNAYMDAGKQWCTRLSIGDICYDKSTVKAFSKAPPENAGDDYGMSVMGDEHSQARRSADGSILNKYAAEDRIAVEKRDREIDARAKAEQKRVKNNREEGKADWAR